MIANPYASGYDLRPVSRDLCKCEKSKLKTRLA